MRESTLRWLHHALKQWKWAPDAGMVPGKSWLRTTRVALGMTTRQLAARVGVSDPAVRCVERAEADGSITLATLQRYAAGLECDVNYMLVPRAPSLRIMIENRAEALHREEFPHGEVDPIEIRWIRHWILTRNLSSLWNPDNPGVSLPP